MKKINLENKENFLIVFIGAIILLLIYALICAAINENRNKISVMKTDFFSVETNIPVNNVIQKSIPQTSTPAPAATAVPTVTPVPQIPDSVQEY